MEIANIEMRRLKIPFRVRFKHASAERSITESVLVIATSESGREGFGEGCPRSYVTHESTFSAMAFFAKFKPKILELKSAEEIGLWVREHKRDIDSNPAGWCAIEIALLDLLGKETGQSVEELLVLPFLKGTFHYSAILGDSDYSTFKQQIQKYIDLGFTDFKVKISGRLSNDRRKLNALKRIEKNSSIRLDANNLWSSPDDAITYLKCLPVDPLAIEEPIKTNHYLALKTIADTFGTKIILDESFLRKEQFENLKFSMKTWVINIRVSKMGGILRSLEVADEARQLGVPIIIGAQVGETSILTRSALTVANTCRDVLLAQEGAFGTRLLMQDVVENPLMFGRGGAISTENLSEKPGLGLVCNLCGL